MTKIMTALALKLTAKGGIDVREAFIDASFAPAKKGGLPTSSFSNANGLEAPEIAAPSPLVRYACTL
jgi:hypothetical protein